MTKCAWPGCRDKATDNEYCQYHWGYSRIYGYFFDHSTEPESDRVGTTTRLEKAHEHLACQFKDGVARCV